jgi:hypothetical protein
MSLGAMTLGGVFRTHALRVAIGVCCAAVLGAVAAAPAGAAFGIESFDMSFAEAPPSGSPPGTPGAPDVQAGSHPFQMTISFIGNHTIGPEGEAVPEGFAKDIDMELPPGVLANPSAVPQCPLALLANGGLLYGEGCPASTQIGTLALQTTTIGEITVPVFNLVPPPGAPAQFGYNVLAPAVIDVSARSEGAYGFTVSFRNVSQQVPVTRTSLTLWGVPADPAHDPLRGSCLGSFGGSNGSCPSDLVPSPLLTLPTSCTGPLTAAIKTDSWENPEVFVGKETESVVGEGLPAGLLGCERLGFAPTVDVRPEVSAADSPTGVLIEMSVPQNNTPGGLAEADMRNATVVLPAGLTVNPAAADGLSGCTQAAVGLGEATAPVCPPESKIGTVELDTPLLANPLSGDNPFGAPLVIYILAEGDGVVAKLPGRLTADPVTGQLTLALEEIPELPLSHMKLAFFGGPRAMLASPPACGSYTTMAQMTPYSEAASSAGVTTLSDFAIDENCGGGFSPTVAAGATSAAAGQTTDFTLQASRADGQQDILRISTTLPPGLLANLAGVPRCGEAQATAGTCEASSRMGSVTIAAGSGSHPYHFNGQAFLTGPYDGAPFGLSIVVPAVAGPFDLGRIVVRASIAVNAGDGQLTIRTDPLPAVLGGVPLRIRAVYLTIDRAGVMVNPTNCSPQTVISTVESTEHAVALLATPFQVNGCSRLPFAPTVTAVTRARAPAGAGARAAAGAGLSVKLSEPNGDAEVKSLALQMPQQLPAELGTLQGACPEAVFVADPTACPKQSQVGSAVVRTSIFANPLRGVTYLVSHGSEALPGPVVVLEGEGVTLDLEGSTAVRKGALTTIFAVPDVPITTFELNLPEGPFPLFGRNLPARADGSFCSSKLTLPTTIVAQNGDQRTRRTKLAVSGCHRAGKRLVVRMPTRAGGTSTRAAGARSR